jgi:hypothetical protein
MFRVFVFVVLVLAVAPAPSQDSNTLKRQNKTGELAAAKSSDSSLKRNPAAREITSDTTQITVRLRSGAAPAEIVAATATTPVQITIDADKGWQPGVTIWCFGVQTNVNINGFRKIKDRTSAVTYTLTDTNDADVIGLTGTMADVDTIKPGSQFGYCGAVTTHTLTSLPNGMWPKDPALAGRMKDPDGSGSGVAQAITDDSAAWNAIQAVANAASSATCDGITAALCTTEENHINNRQGWLVAGEYPRLTALSWYMDNGKIRHRNAALYYIRNIHRITTSPTFGACDESSEHCGRGEENDYISFQAAPYVDAYQLVRDQLSTPDRTTFLQKIFNDDSTGCQNQMGAFGGEVSVDAGSTTITGPSGWTTGLAGKWIYIKRQARFGINDGTLTSIVVSGNTATITTTRDAVAIKDSGFITISGSGVANLDGVYKTIGAQQTYVMTVTVSGVAAGTYSTSGMEIFQWGKFASTGQWLRVTSVDSSTSATLASASAIQQTRSPWAVISDWNSNSCGALWFGAHHDNAPNLGTQWQAQAERNITATETSFPVNTATFNTLPVTAPYYVTLGAEMMRVTNVDVNTRTLTVSRGALSTPATAHTATVDRIFWRRFPQGNGGWTGAGRIQLGDDMNNLQWTKCVGNIMMSSGLLEDALASGLTSATWWLEQSWNTCYDRMWTTFDRLFTGAGTSGGATSGYHLGRMLGFASFMTLVGRNSFSPAVDLTNQWQREGLLWVLYAGRPNNAMQHVMYSDSGTDRSIETDDHAHAIIGQWLYNGTDEQKWWRYWWRNLSSLRAPYSGGSLYEQLPWIVAYTRPTDTEEDFRMAAPRGKIFTNQTDPSYGFKALSSRSSWTDPNATLFFATMLDRAGGDHLGAYQLPGQYQIFKKTEMMCPGLRGCISSADARNQNAVRVIAPAEFGTSTTDNGTLSATIRLAEAAPVGGARVQMSSSDPLIAPPPSVIVPAGATTQTISILGYQTPTKTTAAITATSANSRTVYAAIQALSGAITPVSAAVSSVTVASANFISGNAVVGTVTLVAAAPTGGATVNLASNNPNVIVPASVRVRAGRSAVQFWVSSNPVASSESATITATSLSSAQAGVTITPSTPGTAAVAAVTTGNDNTTGGLLAGNARVALTRKGVGADFTYAQLDNSQAYLATGISVTRAHRELIHLNPLNGQDYVIAHDAIVAAAGNEKISQLSYFRGDQAGPDEVAQVPAPTQTRNGGRVTYRSNQFGASVNSEVLLPAADAIADNFTTATGSSNYGALVTLYLGQTTDPAEALVVHRAAIGTTDTMPATTLISSSATHRAAQIADEAQPWVVVLARDKSQALYNSVSFTSTHPGVGRVLVTHLQPGTYEATGPATISGIFVDTDGIARFDIPAGTVTLVQTGASVPLDIITSACPNGTVGAAYSCQLTASGGAPPYTWSITAGALANGLSLNASTGMVSGTPAASGTSNFTPQITDQAAAIDVSPPALSISVSGVVTPVLTLSSPSKAFSWQLGDIPPADQSVSLATDTGTAQFAATDNAAWLAVSPANGTTTQSGVNLVLAVNPANLLPGDHTAVITITSSEAANSPILLPVTITVTALPAAGINAIATSSGSILSYRVPCANKAVPCRVQVSDFASFTTPGYDAMDLGGLARRRLAVQGLGSSPQPRSVYVRTVCDTHQAVNSVELPASRTAGSIQVSFRYKPPAALAGASNILIEYGGAPDNLAQFATAACASGCDIPLTLTPDSIYFIRHTWRNAGNGTLATSSVYPIAIP